MAISPLASFSKFLAHLTHNANLNPFGFVWLRFWAFWNAGKGLAGLFRAGQPGRRREPAGGSEGQETPRTQQLIEWLTNNIIPRAAPLSRAGRDAGPG